MFDRITCKDVNESDVGKELEIKGWVSDIRNFGGIIFITLRDRYGLLQFVLDSDSSESIKETCNSISYEYCLSLRGIVRLRPQNMINEKMESGKIELKILDINVLSKCSELPFMILGQTQASENLRLKYRYLDLRSKKMQYNIALRYQVIFAIRQFLDKLDFMEIETPTLIKSTPEGARDFVVPSRLHKGKFWALPQSPQIFKQLLMVSGFDRYFQIAHCFRDEDARGDRQAEHTQLDMEMSFVTQDEIFNLTENLFKHVFEKTINFKLNIPFKRLTYQQAMSEYGSDKPDLRIELKLQDITEYFTNSDFDLFAKPIQNGSVVKSLVIKGHQEEFSRKKIDELTDLVKNHGASGLGFAKFKNNEFSGGISKFLKDKKIIDLLKIENEDTIFFVCDKFKKACTSLGVLRTYIANQLNLKSKERFSFCWITSFPLFSYNESEGKWDPEHHIFSMPEEKYLKDLEKNPGDVKGQLYDLVCNGYELASGSIRVHDIDLQKRLFEIIGLDEKEADEKFGFLLDAFKYGPPPHGGIAPGIDRLLMILTGGDTIKDVIAFPKNNTGFNPLDSSPSSIFENQMQELSISIEKNNLGDNK